VDKEAYDLLIRVLEYECDMLSGETAMSDIERTDAPGDGKSLLHAHGEQWVTLRDYELLMKERDEALVQSRAAMLSAAKACNAMEKERDEAREGWKEAVQWLCRLEGAGRKSMPYWEKEYPWLFEAQCDE
jgi:hypothetical protein